MSEPESEIKGVKEVKKAEVKLQESEVSQKRSPARKFFKSFVDVKKWSSYDEISANAKTAWGLFHRLTSHGTREIRQETYEEAVARMGLTAEQLASRKKNFLLSALIYGIFALIFFIYFIYSLINFRLVAAGIMIILVVLMSLTTYREHFWYMQMQKKKLGCTFNDWLHFIMRR